MTGDAFDKLRTRIQGLRAKTIDNGCTEGEALAAAAKVAELLDRHDLSLTDVEIREAPCERREYETHRKKRIPLDDCIGAIAEFCDCRVWREKNPAGEGRYVFFGLRSDVEVAHYLTEVIDTAVRSELGRYKTGAGLPAVPAPGAAPGQCFLRPGHGRVDRRQADGHEGGAGRGEQRHRARPRRPQGRGRRYRTRETRPEAPDGARGPAAWCRRWPTTPAAKQAQSFAIKPAIRES